MNGTSSVYIEDMYAAWQADPKSVHASWDAYFRNVERGAPLGAAYALPPSLAPGAAGATAVATHMGGATADLKTINDHLHVQSIIRSYQVRSAIV